MFSRNRIGIVLGAGALLASSVLSIAPSVAQSADAPPSTVTASAKQTLSWSWADGTTETRRTFTQDEFSGRESEIAVIVYAAPEYPQRRVKLDVREGKRWRTINSGYTDTTAGEGKVTLTIDPICQSGSWCNGKFKLRIRVMKKGSRRGATKIIWATFVPSSGTPSTPPSTAPSTPPSTPATDCSIYPVDSMDYILCMHDPTKDQPVP